MLQENTRTSTWHFNIEKKASFTPKLPVNPAWPYKHSHLLQHQSVRFWAAVKHAVSRCKYFSFILCCNRPNLFNLEILKKRSVVKRTRRVSEVSVTQLCIFHQYVKENLSNTRTTGDLKLATGTHPSELLHGLRVFLTSALHTIMKVHVTDTILVYSIRGREYIAQEEYIWPTKSC